MGLSLSSHAPCPRIHLEQEVVDVGCLVTDHHIHTTFSVSNLGSREGGFFIDVSALPAWISLQPQSGQLQPHQTTEIQVYIAHTHKKHTEFLHWIVTCITIMVWLKVAMYVPVQEPRPHAGEEGLGSGFPRLPVHMKVCAFIVDGGFVQRRNGVFLLSQVCHSHSTELTNTIMYSHIIIETKYCEVHIYSVFTKGG